MKLAASLVLTAGLSLPSAAGLFQLGSAAAADNSEKVEPTDERQRPPGDSELPMTQNNSKSPTASSVIKCWQYGRLIVDERNWQAARVETPESAAFRSESGSYNKLKLLHFGDTFCLMKQAAR